MTFAQRSGPPASHRQVQRLLELVLAAGHTDFRDARGPLGLTQRQAGGKFTRDEAEALTERLEAEAEAGVGAGAAGRELDDRPPSRPVARATPRRAAAANRAAPPLDAVPSAALAEELQRRGWIVVEP